MKINSNSIRKLISAHVFLVMIFVFLWSVIGLPWNAIYIFDLLVCIEFAWALSGIQPVLRRTRLTKLIPFFAIYVLYLILTQVINFVSPVLSVMAYRKTFRFYMFFFACAVLLTKDGIDKIMNMLVKMQIPNLALTMYQYLAQGIRQDSLGGVFGIERGVNAYSNVFLCLICTYMVIKYLEKRVKLLPMLLVIGSALIISALAELKVFYIEIIVIALLAVLLSHPSARTIKTIVFVTVGVVMAITLLGKLFPEHLAILVNFALFMQYATESISGYNISRLNAFSEINKLFFKDSVGRNLFGYGFGNCESGSEFYQRYSSYHYTWFTHQVTFLETGYVGIILNVAFYGLIFMFSTKSKKINPENAFYYTFAQIISVLCLIWMMYDQTLRIEAAYLVFLALAIPVAVRNNWAKNLSQRSN